MPKRRTTSLEILRQKPDVLTDLEEDFRETGNPICPWLAMHHSFITGLELPTWAKNYFVQSASGIQAIVEEAEKKLPIGRLADRIAKLMGFGNDGEGPSRWFTHTALRNRDWLLHDAVVSAIVIHGIKRNSAYEEVAKAHRVSPAVVGKAFVRMERDVQEENAKV
jgi:hypothetical protein